MTTKETKNNSIMSYSKIKEVTFNGVTMLGIQTESGKVFTGIRKICEDLGIDFSSQLKKIKRDDILKEGVVIITIPSNSGMQDISCIELDCLPVWLSKISIKHCKSEIQPLLLDFKKQAKEILAKAFIENKKADEVSRKELALMILQAEEEREKLLLENNQLKYEKTFAENKITELTPKALLLDVLTNTTELKTVKQLGYKLKPFGLGPLKIFELLRNEKIITKVNGENYPTHAYTNYFVTDAVTKAWQDSKTGNIKKKTFDILKAKPDFYPVLAQVLIKNKILTSDQFNEIDFNNVPADSSIDNQIFY